jgi:hypothetical protein
MTGNDAQYRLKVAQGFLVEARQDVDLGRWRSAVDNAQLAVENAAKAVLSLAGPVGRSHNPAMQLRQVLHDKLFAAPHFWTTSRDQVVYHVTVLDQLGRERKGWVRCGSWWFGLFSNKAEVRWDE